MRFSRKRFIYYLKKNKIFNLLKRNLEIKNIKYFKCEVMILKCRFHKFVKFSDILRFIEDAI